MHMGTRCCDTMFLAPHIFREGALCRRLSYTQAYHGLDAEHNWRDDRRRYRSEHHLAGILGCWRGVLTFPL